MTPVQVENFEMKMRPSRLDADRVAVGSRRQALNRLRDALDRGRDGAVLITGEPGIGKTWLVRRFIEELPTGWQIAELEMSSALDGLELLRLAGAGLDLAIPDRLGAARLKLGAGLRDAATDGRNWLLIIDEVQRASANAWEEVQALSNQLGSPGGFSALILIGRTELARKLATLQRQGWRNCLFRHIHLPPLDLDEARQLLDGEGVLSQALLETIHRDALGNPRMMRRLAEVHGRTFRPTRSSSAPQSVGLFSSPQLPHTEPPSQSEPFERLDEPSAPSAVAVAPAIEEAAAPKRPALIPARPPIRVEDGLVEVGWDGDLESESVGPSLPPLEPDAAAPVQTGPSEERVEDRYTALQAWEEWSRNRERLSAPAINRASPLAEVVRDPDADVSPSDESARADAGNSTQPFVRAETMHEFAPYSQLFGRLRHSL